MRFDPARATALFEEMGSSSFAGPDGESRLAEFVADHFEQFGLTVARREVEGSRFPGRAAPWIGWLGYGAPITAAYLLVLARNARAGLLAIVVIVPAHAWLRAVLLNRIRWGRQIPPIESAPLVVAQGSHDSSSPVRVVFQAVLGDLKTDLLQSGRLTRARIMRTHAGFFLSIAVTVAARQLDRPVAFAWWLGFDTLLLALLWLAIVRILCGELRESPAAQRSLAVDRHGLAVIIELARTWPRSASRPIEVIFAVAGGQGLDFAGSRAVLRALDSEWPAKPSLLLLFFAPGAGGEHRLVPIVSASPEAAALAGDVARSLWIPTAGVDPWSHSPFWPFGKGFNAADVIALVGAHSALDSGAPINSQNLVHAAQLATEIALRWAKKQQPLQADGGAAGSVGRN